MAELVAMAERAVPEREAIIAITSGGGGGAVNSGFMNIILRDAGTRTRTQQQIADQISTLVRGLTGARAFVTQDQTIGGRTRGLPVQFVIQAPNFEKLKERLPQFLAAADSHPAFQVVDANLKFNKPEARVQIDRDRAKALGVSAIDIAQTLQAAFSGQRFDYFVMNAKLYQVIGQVRREDRDDPTDLKSLYVKNSRRACSA